MRDLALPKTRARVRYSKGSKRRSAVLAQFLRELTQTTQLPETFYELVVLSRSDWHDRLSAPYGLPLTRVHHGKLRVVAAADYPERLVKSLDGLRLAAAQRGHQTPSSWPEFFDMLIGVAWGSTACVQLGLTTRVYWLDTLTATALFIRAYCYAPKQAQDRQPRHEQLARQQLQDQRLQDLQLPDQELPGQKLPGQKLPGQKLPGQELPGQQPLHQGSTREQLVVGDDAHVRQLPPHPTDHDDVDSSQEARVQAWFAVCAAAGTMVAHARTPHGLRPTLILQGHLGLAALALAADVTAWRTWQHIIQELPKPRGKADMTQGHIRLAEFVSRYPKVAILNDFIRASESS